MSDKNTLVMPQPVVEALAKGRIVFYGEFRGGQAVEFPGKGGKVYHQSRCSVETAPGVSVSVQEFLPDNVDWTKWVAPFAKGTMVMGLVRNCSEESGVQKVSAKLVAI